MAGPESEKKGAIEKLIWLNNYFIDAPLIVGGLITQNPVLFTAGVASFLGGWGAGKYLESKRRQKGGMQPS